MSDQRNLHEAEEIDPGHLPVEFTNQVSPDSEGVEIAENQTPELDEEV